MMTFGLEEIKSAFRRGKKTHHQLKAFDLMLVGGDYFFNETSESSANISAVSLPAINYIDLKYWFSDL